MTDDESSVRVAVRIRPQLAREVIDMCRVCTVVTPGEPQVTIGADKSFTYDFVFDTESDQGSVFQTTVAPLVNGSLQGYNATVLAYGQTGSGKTFTMGTGFEVETNADQLGIIPRAIHMLFDGITNLSNQAHELNQPEPQFKVTAQFLELYNEEIFDLFDASNEFKVKSGIKIHEDSEHSIYVTGVRSERVNSADEALSLLRKGALSRTTAATQMNCQSSRSHAIFTLHIKQQRVVKVEEEDEEERGGQEFETLTAKFHFVDLAGSERLKRTGATGERAKEGIAINCGLLALGNVISALGDRTKRALHVPYRDSKLTRLLQDSLGGNSRTLMIACVSPSDRDFMETLNTLKYANRARNIQNRVVVNQDKSSRTISLLKKEIQQLQLELLEYKQGKRIIGEDGNESVNDMFHENKLLQCEVDALRSRVKGLQEVIDSLTARNTELLAEREMAAWSLQSDSNKDEMCQMVKGYLTEIETLRAKLVESEAIVVQLRKDMSRVSKIKVSPRTDNSSLSESGIEEVLDIAKRDVEKDLESIKASKHSAQGSDLSGSESDSSSSETEEEAGKYSEDLAELTSEISVKQRLIEALENTNKRLNLMKQQYEEKLLQLQARINATEKERDTVLASYSNVESKQPSDKMKKIKDEYEKKLSGMQKEMKSLLSAKREHAKLLRNQSQYENQIRQLTCEVQDMKRTKVKLMKKIREEAVKYKEVETRRNREIAQLKKKTRQDANMIKTLEAEKKAKAIVLKRKQEEVSALRKAAQGRKMGRRHGQSSQAKHHWISLEKNIAEMAMSRQSAVSLEKEMEKKMEVRTELQEELNSKLAMLNDPRFSNSSVIKEEVDSVKANLEHIQSAISDLQHEILQVEESKSQFESEDLIRILVDMGEAPYILEKLYNMALHHSCLNAEKDATLLELQAENEQLKRESEMQEQLLKHLVEGKGAAASTVSTPSSSSSRSPSPQPSDGSKNKRRPRKALSPMDLLFPTDSAPPKKTSSSAAASPERLCPPPLLRSLTTVKVPSSAPGSPVYLRKGVPISPKPLRKNTYVISSANYPSMERGLELAGSPPASPPTYRRQSSREENVFSRLTSQPPSTTRNPGKITSFTFRKNQKSPLYCTHVVEGHARAVLAVHATEDNLFTASRDRSVLVWDLKQMREIEMFPGHPNNVVAVKYHPEMKLVFAASSAFVRVWDLRSSKCIRTLSSSGLSASWSNQQNNNGEPQMNDIALGDNIPMLYTAAGDKVRVWDLRKFSVIGKLIGGHQAAVMCLAVGSDTVVTGSKDHYIKLFDINIGSHSSVGIVTPRVTLDPPHYDGIQCLELTSDTLFSGSRDGIIKKWNTRTHELLYSLNSAHKDWVTGMCQTGGGLLVSGCRDGTIKLWSPHDCSCLGEIKAHSSAINALAANSAHIFTAANSGEVMMWKETPQEQDIMTMSTGHILQLSV